MSFNNKNHYILKENIKYHTLVEHPTKCGRDNESTALNCMVAIACS